MARYDFIAVYIMANEQNGTLYVGVTSDLLARVYLHRIEKAPGFTERYQCKQLVWWEQHGDMPTAIAREKQLKKWRRAWKLRLIEEMNPGWRDLYLDFKLSPSRSYCFTLAACTSARVTPRAVISANVR
jgi:putative endonuclease